MVSSESTERTYWIMTGATGLLGAYLMRDLLTRGERLAVIVRGKRKMSPQQRVEGLIQHWETSLGRPLPRPVALEGDLSQPSLGLSLDDQEWVREHGRALLHNAASLRFYLQESTGEPYRSNVDGTRHAIDVSRSTGIREFHHVSTAYVAGLAEGRVYENDSYERAKAGNDYEASKRQAEALVRSADCFDSVTCYRPGIIVGDSQTGFTTTFHGLYVPIKLIMASFDALASQARTQGSLKEAARLGGDQLTKLLGLEGDEKKHLIPVEWVSEAMTRLLVTPSLHGSTYHLAGDSPVTIGDIRDSVAQVFLDLASERTVEARSSNLYEQFGNFFREGMETYRAYFRSDPEFDDTNLRTALPDLRPPVVDVPLLCRLVRAAADAKFQEPYFRTDPPPADSWQQAAESGDPVPSAVASSGTMGVRIVGPHGGDWTVTPVGSERVRVTRGLAGDGLPTLELPREEWLKRWNGRSEQPTLTPATQDEVRSEAGMASLTGDASLWGWISQQFGVPEAILTPQTDLQMDLGLEDDEIRLLVRDAARHCSGRDDLSLQSLPRTLSELERLLSERSAHTS